MIDHEKSTEMRVCCVELLNVSTDSMRGLDPTHTVEFRLILSNPANIRIPLTLVFIGRLMYANYA